MEEGRSLSPAQITLQCTKRALQRQQKIREKEKQLCNQLEEVCQNQQDAHKRNRDLLKDFRRIEQELSLLAAKTTSFKKKQENYKKHLHTFLPEHLKCPACNLSHHTCDKQLNDLPATSQCNHYQPCHLSLDRGLVGQEPLHFSACPNQHLGLKGCCNSWAWHCTMHPQFPGCSGEPTQAKCIIPDSILQSQSEVKRNFTNNSLLHKDDTIMPNASGPRVQKYTEAQYNNEDIIQGRMTPPHTHCKPHQCACSSGVFDAWREIIFMLTQQRMMGDEVFHTKNTVGKSDNEESRERPVLYQSVPSKCYSDHQNPSDSSYKSQYVSYVLHDDNTKVSKPGNKIKHNITSKEVNEIHPDGKNVKQYVFAHALNQSHDSDSCLDKLGSSSITMVKGVSQPSFERNKVIDIDNQAVNEKNVCLRIKNDRSLSQVSINSGQSEKMKNTSEEESVSEAGVGGPVLAHVCNPTNHYQHEEMEDLGIPVPLSKEQSEEFNDSNQEHYEQVEIGQESDKPNSPTKHSPLELNVQSDSSEEDSETANRYMCNISDREQKVKQKGILKGEDACELSSSEGENIIINQDIKNGMLDLNTVRQEAELEEVSENHKENVEGKNGRIEIFNGTGKKTLKTRKLDQECRMIENNEGCAMYGADTDVDTSGEEKESDKGGSEDSDHDMGSDIIGGEKEELELENDSEDTSEEDGRRTSGEDDVRGVEEENRSTSGEDDIISDSEEQARQTSEGDDLISGDDDVHKSQIGISDGIPQLTINENRVNTKARKGEMIMEKNRNNIPEIRKENELTSDEDTEQKVDTPEGDEPFSEEDEGNEIDSSEEEESANFQGSNPEGSESTVEEAPEVQRSSQDKDISTNNSIRKEEAPQPPEAEDMEAVQDLVEDEYTDTERQRLSWLCCLNTHSLPQFCNKRKSETVKKRCSEDGTIGLIQMNPTESGSSLPPLEAPKSPHLGNSEAVSVSESQAEESSEELFHSENKSENQNQAWSDSEDNVHSFYD